eukprot:TRINITY_DN31296_c0_g1_i1.p1 TRINITY_DN31296_c0_g1~~TRINITY_DN31296_c0_g1_i1.p1  ORF type:complete len:592 (+),score=124.23 TRINITY_DN31296_c0_g1_i1:41-1777(+)
MTSLVPSRQQLFVGTSVAETALTLLRRALRSRWPERTAAAALLAVLAGLIRWWRRRRWHQHWRSRSVAAGGFWLRVTSPLRGSTVKYHRPIWKHGAEEVASWRGFCPCCKRPVELEPASRPPAPKCLPEARGKYAYVITLWGASPCYALGALVLGHSIKRTGTPHSLVCIHTPDVPEGMLKLLASIWDCRPVDHVHSTKALTTWKEPNRFDNVFTKLHCLGLVEFEKVLMMDIDLLVTANVDDLFELSAPAALRRGMNDSKWPLKHGDYIDGRPFFAGASSGQYSWGQGTGINAGVMLLQPNEEVLQTMLEEIKDPNHPSHCEANGPEQDYLSRFWADAPWTQISVQYNYQLHQMFYALQPNYIWTAERNQYLSAPESIKIIHFSGEGVGKPWRRVMDDGGKRWPRRELDEAYMLEVAETFRGYWLWVRRDPTFWSQTRYARDTDGFELGEDGEVYRSTDASWRGTGDAASEESAKAPRERVELPDWATRGTMEVLTWSLQQWFDACEELESRLGGPEALRAALLEATATSAETATAAAEAPTEASACASDTSGGGTEPSTGAMAAGQVEAEGDCASP